MQYSVLSNLNFHHSILFANVLVLVLLFSTLLFLLFMLLTYLYAFSYYPFLQELSSLSFQVPYIFNRRVLS